MSHLLDFIAIAIVLVCTAYAARTLLPNAVLVHIPGNNRGNRTAAKKSGSCGSCDGCATDNSKADNGCH